MRQTKDPAFPVVPVILPNTRADLPFDFLHVLTWIDFSHVTAVGDAPEQLEAVVRAARDAGATGAWANLLYLRPGTREHFLAHLATDWPEQLERYAALYHDRAYLPKSATEETRKQVRELVRRYEVRDRRTVRLLPDPEPEQLAFPLVPGELPESLRPPGSVA